MINVRHNLEVIKNRVFDIARRSGRDPDDIVILGVTKGIDIERILAGIEAGLDVLGENRVQEAERKIPFIERDVEWHMIGHLQRNKVKKAIKLFDVIQSIDRIPLVEEFKKKLDGQRMRCLIEVNTSGEPQKHGADPSEIKEVFKAVIESEVLDPIGLMTVGPYPPGPEVSKRAFRLLREIRNRLEAEFKINLPVLSMGMTEDFEWAIEEGSTMIRIGRGIFGKRNY